MRPVYKYLRVTRFSRISSKIFYKHIIHERGEVGRGEASQGDVDRYIRLAYVIFEYPEQGFPGCFRFIKFIWISFVFAVSTRARANTNAALTLCGKQNVVLAYFFYYHSLTVFLSALHRHRRFTFVARIDCMMIINQFSDTLFQLIRSVRNSHPMCRLGYIVAWTGGDKTR